MFCFNVRIFLNNVVMCGVEDLCMVTHWKAEQHSFCQNHTNGIKFKTKMKGSFLLFSSSNGLQKGKKTAFF